MLQQFWSLRRLLTLQVIVAALVPLIGALIWLLLWLLPTLESNIVENNQALAQALALQTEDYLTKPLNSLQHLGRQVARQSILDQRQLDAYVATSDLFESIYVVDSRSHMRALAVPERTPINRADFVGLDLSTAPVLNRAQNLQRVEWSDANLSPVSGASVVASVIPAGESLVVGEISLQQLSEFVRRMATGNTRMIIVDRRGLAVAHPDPRATIEQVNYSNLPIFPQPGDRVNEPLTRHFAFEGAEVVGTRVVVPQLGWYVMVMRPVAEVYQPVKSIAFWLLAASVLAAMVIAWVGVYLARHLSGRFEALAATARALAGGTLPVRWPRTRVKEIASLTESLDFMGKAVMEREAALRELNQTLESKVDERTAALQRTQADLERSEKLAALGALVAGIAHELNTPIGNALIVATTLESSASDFRKKLDEGLRRSQLERYLENEVHACAILARNLQRASELIGSFKQLAVDQTTSQRRKFLLEELISGNVLALEPLLRRGKCHVRINAIPACELDSYPGPFGQVLGNLLSNAMVHGYGEAGGEIVVDASLAGDTVRIAVTDYGAGIASEHQKRVFDPFFTIRMGQGGSGLGLHLCYTIVHHLLGGEIEVRSRLGEGTTFVVTLPLVAPMHPEPVH